MGQCHDALARIACNSLHSHQELFSQLVLYQQRQSFNNNPFLSVEVTKPQTIWAIIDDLCYGKLAFTLVQVNLNASDALGGECNHETDKYGKSKACNQFSDSKIQKHMAIAFNTSQLQQSNNMF